MARFLAVLNSPADQARVIGYIRQAPVGTRVELKTARRTLPQNDRMWAMLTDISIQKDHNGRKYEPDGWKVIFLHALGREVQFIPALDGKSFIPWGQSSSDLTKEEMTNLIDLMFAWGSENGVVFHEP